MEFHTPISSRYFNSLLLSIDVNNAAIYQCRFALSGKGSVQTLLIQLHREYIFLSDETIGTQKKRNLIIISTCLVCSLAFNLQVRCTCTACQMDVGAPLEVLKPLLKFGCCRICKPTRYTHAPSMWLLAVRIAPDFATRPCSFTPFAYTKMTSSRSLQLKLLMEQAFNQGLLGRLAAIDSLDALTTNIYLIKSNLI